MGKKQSYRHQKTIAFMKDVDRVHQVSEILQENWVNGASLIARVEAMSDILIAYDESGISGFSTWIQKELELNGKPLFTAYMGITAIKDSKKGLGIGKYLVRSSLEFAKREVENIRRERSPFSPVIWGTTVSPVAFLGLQKIVPDLWPRQEADESLTSLLRVLRKSLGVQDVDGESLHVLRKISSAFYQAPERERIEGVREIPFLPLFDTIDEKEGDRILMVFSVGAL